MSDFMAVQSVAGTGNAARPAPIQPQPEIKKSAESENSGASKDYDSDQGASAQAAKAREIAERQALDENILTGPPPSFQASLLEVEGQLDNILKRMESDRERARAQQDGATAPKELHKQARDTREVSDTAPTGEVNAAPNAKEPAQEVTPDRLAS